MTDDLTLKNGVHYLPMKINCSGTYSAYFVSSEELDLSSCVVRVRYNGDSPREEVKDLSWKGKFNCRLPGFGGGRGTVVRIEIEGLAADFFKKAKMYVHRRNMDSVLGTDVPFFYIGPTILPMEDPKPDVK